VRNDIRFSILDAFKEQGIQIAYTLKIEELPADAELWPGSEVDNQDKEDDPPKVGAPRKLS
jgi:small-conductance mechanosensitive channel